ncbi:Uroporphyrinogen III synthase HEM4 [Ferroglobus placidus DSM 10642]|uniref:Uroporphyrinogen III synthase HEM4 n=1 Tax=Ferroglobus placidus (strain DSM 10642 / AEDII12DO) TaxID=589924 RepID=D3RX70_FERPA|nr:uroporphyrinogen-III synthase [Ferroglobus placidus]ADC65083.1 Uroporphyrinogen III synthase HEM4 [Ferroglobus placidus DSM 10642]
MKVAFFSPKNSAEEVIEEIKKFGFTPIHVPMVEIVEREVNEVRDADYTIVTSKTAAKMAVSKNFVKGDVIAIGEKTAEILKDFNPITPSKYDSKTLYEEFRDFLKGRKVNLLRSDKGDEILLKLSEICDLKEYVLYEIKPIVGEEQKKIVRRIVEGEIDAVIFSSRLIVRSFFENAKACGIYDKAAKRLNEIKTIALGKPSWEELKKFGVSAAFPKKYTFSEALKLIR